MGHLNFDIPQSSRGEAYTQVSIGGADYSSGFTLVPAKANCVGVIDHLFLSTVNNQTWGLFAATYNGDDLLATSNILAKTPINLQDFQGNGLIRSDTVNEAIILTVSAGAVAGFVKYHYESVLNRSVLPGTYDR